MCVLAFVRAWAPVRPSVRSSVRACVRPSVHLSVRPSICARRHSRDLNVLVFWRMKGRYLSQSHRSATEDICLAAAKFWAAARRRRRLLVAATKLKSCMDEWQRSLFAKWWSDIWNWMHEWIRRSCRNRMWRKLKTIVICKDIVGCYLLDLWVFYMWEVQMSCFAVHAGSY